MSEQNQNQLPPPPDQMQPLPLTPEAALPVIQDRNIAEEVAAGRAAREVAATEVPRQGRISELWSRTNARYDAWLDRQVQRNPGMEKGRLSVMTGVAGGLAVLAAYKLGPAYAEHIASAVTKSSTEVGDKVLDGAAFSLTTGLAFGAGMNYLDRRKGRKQAQR